MAKCSSRRHRELEQPSDHLEEPLPIPRRTASSRGPSPHPAWLVLALLEIPDNPSNETDCEYPGTCCSRSRKRWNIASWQASEGRIGTWSHAPHPAPPRPAPPVQKTPLPLPSASGPRKLSLGQHLQVKLVLRQDRLSRPPKLSPLRTSPPRDLNTDPARNKRLKDYGWNLR
jgi:hypothetical protein